MVLFVYLSLEWFASETEYLDAKEKTVQHGRKSQNRSRKRPNYASNCQKYSLCNYPSDDKPKHIRNAKPETATALLQMHPASINCTNLCTLASRIAGREECENYGASCIENPTEKESTNDRQREQAPVIQVEL